MRTLCLLSKSPLPPETGSKQRLFHLIRSLHSLGAVDFAFEVPITATEAAALRDAFDGARVWAPATPVPRHPRGRLRWLTRRDLPLRLALADPTAARRDVARFVASSPEPYGAVWSFGSTPSWTLGRSLRSLPLVIDLADVQHVLVEHARRAVADGPAPTSPAHLKQRARLRMSRDRWERFERFEGGRANFVTVCSAEDRELHGIPGAVVVPNGYRRPSPPGGRATTSSPPVVLFPGQMTYGPNIDGARWLVDDVLPELRALEPSVTVRIVGRTGPEVEVLRGRDGVDIVGYVERIEDELARADAVAVPLRQGSGTRIKIVEAWAHRLPVVSTTLGAEGLAARDGDDLLLADDASSFAHAIARVLRDEALRTSLVASAQARFDEQFDWDIIEADFARRVATMVEGSHRFDGVARRTSRTQGSPA